jgi:hypothetical protein
VTAGKNSARRNVIPRMPAVVALHRVKLFTRSSAQDIESDKLAHSISRLTKCFAGQKSGLF